jgi:hypothetical protein
MSTQPIAQPPLQGGITQNVHSVDSTGTSLGTSANPIYTTTNAGVAIPDTIATGNLTAAQPTVGTGVTGGTVSITLGQGQGTVEAQLTGTFSAGTTVLFEGTDDTGTTTNWVTAVGKNTSVINPPDISSIAGGTVPVIIRLPSGGYQQIRMRANPFQGGDNVAVRLVASVAGTNLGAGGLVSNDGSFATQTTAAAIKTDLDEIALDTDNLAGIKSDLDEIALDTDNLANIKSDLDTIVTNTTGVSTAANQATANTTLSGIKSDLDEIALDTDNLSGIKSDLDAMMKQADTFGSATNLTAATTFAGVPTISQLIANSSVSLANPGNQATFIAEINIATAFNGTLSFYGLEPDGASLQQINAHQRGTSVFANNTAINTGVALNQTWVGNCAGFKSVYVVCTTFTSGSASVQLGLSAAPYAVHASSSDGAIATLGSTTDSAATDTTSAWTVEALVRYLINLVIRNNYDSNNNLKTVATNATYESTSGGPTIVNGTPSGLSLDQRRNAQGKKYAQGTITATLAGDTQLVFSAAPLTLPTSAAIILSGGANPIEKVYATTGWAPGAGLTTVPLQNPVIYANHTTATWDVTGVLGPQGSLSATGLALSALALLDPTSTGPTPYNEPYSATEDAIPTKNAPIVALGVYNGATVDRVQTSKPVPTSVADGGNVTIGNTTDAAVTTDANGTLSGKLRGLVKILNDIWDSTNHLIHFDLKQVAGSAISSTNPVNVELDRVNGSALSSTNPVNVELDRVNGAAFSNTNPLFIDLVRVLGSALSTSNPVFTQPVVGTSGGSTPSHTMSAASTNATSLKASAGQVCGLSISNANASARFFKLYNKASAPTVGTDVPVLTLGVPGNGTVIRVYPFGLALGTGIAWACTGGIADADTTAIGANDCSIDIDYK